jgi:hypothetical protein
MYEVKETTLIGALKPFDIVSIENGAVGYVREVSVNDCQADAKNQIRYAVNWLIGYGKTAWWDHNDLKYHCNLFVKIAEDACHNMGRNEARVQELFNSINR